eukprot:Skav228931  [mRNA]  locus=scaffold2181:195318:204630:- [translate_table: standard]
MALTPSKSYSFALSKNSCCFATGGGFGAAAAFRFGSTLAFAALPPALGFGSGLALAFRAGEEAAALAAPLAAGLMPACFRTAA